MLDSFVSKKSKNNHKIYLTTVAISGLYEPLRNRCSFIAQDCHLLMVFLCNRFIIFIYQSSNGKFKSVVI